MRVVTGANHTFKLLNHTHHAAQCWVSDQPCAVLQAVTTHVHPWNTWVGCCLLTLSPVVLLFFFAIWSSRSSQPIGPRRDAPNQHVELCGSGVPDEVLSTSTASSAGFPWAASDRRAELASSTSCSRAATTTSMEGEAPAPVSSTEGAAAAPANSWGGGGK
jgi:hypothetical protein